MSHLRFIHPSFEIPPSIQTQILPNPTCSVLEFLDFPLPIISAASTTHAALAFFSTEKPTTDDVKIIQGIPVPLPTTVAELSHECKSAVHSGNQSVCCVHISGLATRKRLPLWVIPYWAEVINLRSSSREHWVRAEAALRKRNQVWRDPAEFNTSLTVIEEAYNILSALPWSGEIHGFDNTEPIHSLASYATHQWMSDVHENQMLDILRRSLMLRGESGFEIENLAFIPVLEQAYKHRESGEYEEIRYFRRVRGVGQALSCGARKALGLLANIGNKHWVAVMLDFDGDQILYGDSMGNCIPKALREMFDWWTYHHTGRTFTHARLRICHQLDGFSCGLLAFNALGHHFLPETFPLIDTADVDNERLKIFLKVARRHMDQVS
jgi:hypothetical protein